LGKLLVPASEPGWLAAAQEALAADGLVIFPTDTVYGLGCAVDSPAAIDKLFRIKGRPGQKAIPVLLGDVEQLDLVCVDVPLAAYRLTESFWPGALTIVLPRHPRLPEALGPQATLGVRMPDHPLALQLLRAYGPLAVTSANLSGAGENRTAEQARAELGGQVELTIDGGETPGGVPSTVVDLTQAGFPVLRPGPISRQALDLALDARLEG